MHRLLCRIANGLLVRRFRFQYEKNEGLGEHPIWDVSEFLLGVAGVDLAYSQGPSCWDDPCSNFI
jgi:hypothetical protein